MSGQQLPDPDEPGPGVGLVRASHRQADLVDHRHRQRVLVRIDPSEHGASLILLIKTVYWLRACICGDFPTPLSGVTASLNVAGRQPL